MWPSFFLLVVFWGFSFIAIRFSLEAFPPFAAAGLRIAIAALLSMIAACAAGVPFPKRRSVFNLMLLGVIDFGIPWGCLFWGEQFVSPAVASILNSTVPLFVFLFSWGLLADERPSRLKAMGVGLGFLGILLIFAPSAANRSLGPRWVMGAIAVLTMAISYGLGSVMTKRWIAAADVRWNLAIQGFSASSLLLLLSFLKEDRSWITGVGSHPKAVGSLLYLAVCSTFIAWLFYFRLIREWGVLRASAVTYLIPLVAVAIDWVYDRKLPTGLQLIGAGLIVGGVAVLNAGRMREKMKKLSSQAMESVRARSRA